MLGCQRFVIGWPHAVWSSSRVRFRIRDELVPSLNVARAPLLHRLNRDQHITCEKSMKQRPCEFDEAMAHLSRKRAHLLCTSLFNPGAPDQPLGDRYRQGLANWVARLNAEPRLAERFHLVIFVDDSVEAPRVPEHCVTVVRFCFPTLQRRDGPGHINMFGTLARFYPMFAPPPAGMQLVDVDMREEIGRNEFELHATLADLATQLKGQVDILYLSWRLHHAFQQRDHSFKEAMKLHGHTEGLLLPYALSNFFCCMRPVPRQLLTDFVDGSLRGAISDRWGYQWAMPDDSPPHEGVFSYGTDEMFLNAYFIPALLKANWRFATLDWISPFEPFVAIHRDITRLDRWRAYGLDPEELKELSWADGDPARMNRLARVAWDVLCRLYSDICGSAGGELVDGWLPRRLLANLIQFKRALQDANTGMVLTRYDSQGGALERRYLPGLTMHGVGRLRWA